MRRSARRLPDGRCLRAAVVGAVVGIVADRVYRSMRPHGHVVTRPPDRLPRPGSEDFARLLARVSRDPRTTGNTVAVHDGTRHYKDALLAALESAEETIWFEMFWWHEGRFSDAVIERLEQAVGRGVDVRLVVDGFGADALGTPRFETMREKGVQVAVYHPVRPWHLRRLNHRSHRRIMVVDGKRALTGGIGIGDEWLGQGGRPAWADILVEVEGPAAGDLAALFADHWRIRTGDPLAERRVFLHDERPGRASVQLLSGGPEDGGQHMRTALLIAIAAARDRVRAVSPYFVPDDLVRQELVAAADRGVDVEVIVPSKHIDRPIVRRASRSLWGPLLEAGVRILEFQPTMLHTKALAVDDAWAMVGSINLDERSFRLNAELAVATEDRRTVRAVGRCLDGYVERSRPVALDEWRHRPVVQRAGDEMSCLLRAQL